MQVQTPDFNRGPCSGIRVLEFSSMVAGPLAGQNLGDLGADVIKIEGLVGDTARMMGPPFRAGLSGFFTQMNRNKRSIVVDLKSDEGKQIVRTLAQSADVVIENFRSGVMDSLGLGYDDLKAINPKLIFVAISGFGPTGPYSELPVYDLVIQGMSGMMPIQGSIEQPKMFQTVMADKNAAITAASCTLAALLARERFGVGQRVDVPMLDAYAQLTMPDVVCTETFQPPEKFERNYPDLFRTWKTKDGWVVGVAIEDRQFAGICKALECEHLIDEAQFKTIVDRFVNFTAMTDALDKYMLNWNSADVVTRARANGAPFAPVYTMNEFLEDPQVKHNRTVFTANDTNGGETLYVRHPGHYSETPATMRRHAPRFGEHTNEILAEAGFSADRIEALRSSKVVA
jgi:crotonobetainyl-CoA:carnitine CoA-transferase CaiB-like acyl-CoA transferase